QAEVRLERKEQPLSPPRAARLSANQALTHHSRFAGIVKGAGTRTHVLFFAEFSREDRPVLLELRVENYAVIDSLAVEFAPGLNLLTGETGAGKSILIDALSLLLGDKASTEMIRHGAEKAVVSGVFEVEERALDRILEENGIEAEGGQVIVKREISAGGKGRVFVNNQPATVALLRQLAPALASIHAQNENILVFDAEARLQLLDSYAGNALTDLSAKYVAWA